jgi:MFS family permease
MKARATRSRHLAALLQRLRPADEFALNRRFIASSTHAFNISFYLTNGSFLTGYLLLLHADNGYLGLYTMVLMLGNAFQFLAPLLLNRISRRRPILLAMRAFYQILNILLVGLAFQLPAEVQLPFLLAVTFLGYAGSAVTTPGVLAWQIRSIPEDLRVRYFSYLNVSVNLLNFVAILAASRVVDALKSDGQEMLGLTVLRLVAVAFAVLDLLLLARIREYPEPPAPAHLGILLHAFRDRAYLGTVAFAVLWSFVTSLSGPYFMAYLLQDVGMAYTTISLVSSLLVPVMLATTPLWARRIERQGLSRSYRLCMLLYSLHYFAIAFTSKTTLFLYPLAAVYSFVISTGMGNVMTNMPYRNLPEVDRTGRLGFYAAATSLAAILGILAGQQFVGATQSVRVTLFGVGFGNRQLVLFLTGGTMLLSALALFVANAKRRLAGAPADGAAS